MFESYLDRWSLVQDGTPIITPSSHLLPVFWQKRPAMLKIATDAEEKFGGLLMRWWNGDGAAAVYECEGDAVLLERAMGQRSLFDMAMNGEDDEASRIICRTIERLHVPRDTPPEHLVPLDQWFRELEPAARTYGGVFMRCAEIARHLLAEPRDQTVLHGDVHHRNILDFGKRGWLAIDPKRIHGERGFDYANTFCNPELPIVRAPGRLQRQLSVVCDEARLEPRRTLRWIIAYAGLSAAWFLSDGDNENAGSDLTIAQIALAELEA
ncbi:MULTISPECIES: aminoglycoside phosphotransferase family protein [unclassified Sinorhizobium]|uniref:aminoglycoside phosphotransferase family protein n=1 Tax=unclassified Sinorhizobium TaxID=2613772 RepID=UPI0035235540